jgi:3'-5' exoribonuclease 1
VEQVDTTHPIYKKFSRINGKVNTMSVEQLCEQLKQFGLHADGSEASCKTRIKHFFRDEVNEKIKKKKKEYLYDVICVIDFEATCELENQTKDCQEIIEFPAYIIDVRRQVTVSKFHEYVRPQVNKKLSNFCTELTGIKQKTVDTADMFEDVLDRFEAWFYSYLVENGHKSFAIATDGPWDMAHFFAGQCKLSNIAFPSYAKRWINIRKVFNSHYKMSNCTLDMMLGHLGLEFEGRKHSGIDDTKNIANVLIRMLVDGANPVINERLSWRQVDRQQWQGLSCGYVRVYYNKPSDGLNMSDSEDSFYEDD